MNRPVATAARTATAASGPSAGWPAPTFSRPLTLRFGHCDPAGIVFHPRYFELFHELVEQWFDDGLGLPYGAMLSERRLGFPVVHADCDFRAMSRVGERIVLGLAVERLGSSSVTLAFACHGADGLRVQAREVIVAVDLERGCKVALPADLRAAMQRFVAGDAADAPAVTAP